MATFGWKAGAEQYPPGELLDYAKLADEAGFDLLDISDHFHPWSEEGQACFAWTWLGAAAVSTRRIRLGTGVTAPILRYHPAVVAQAAATLAVMAPGRAWLGVGTGEALNDSAATGYWPHSRERQARLREAVGLMRALWAGEPVTHEGEFWEMKGAQLFTRPEQPVPIVVSSMVPESAALAGELGDGLITVGGKEPGVYRQILAQFEAGARATGKDPARMPRMIELHVSYANGQDEAVEAAKTYWAGAFVPALFVNNIYTPKQSAENGAMVGTEAIAKATCMATDPDLHVEFARQYLDLGFTDLVFHSTGPDQRAFIEGYGRDVLPRLRAMAEPLRRTA